MVKAIKVMLIPNNVQKTKMFQYAGASRFAYNWALAREIENYEKGGGFISDAGLRKEFTKLRHSDEYAWLLNISNNVTKQAIKDACTAYKNFFRGLQKFPRFKSKKRSMPKFYQDNVKIRFSNTHVKFEGFSSSRKANKQKMNWVRLAEYGRIPTNAKYMNPRISFEAGFNHVVFIIRKDIEQEFKEVIGERIKGWKSAIVTWYQKFKESVFFRKLFLLFFVTSMILFRTLLNRNLWMNPLSKVMGGWGIWETVNGEQKITTECIENVIMMVPFSSVVMWTFKEKTGNGWKKILWYSGKIAFIFSVSIEMLQLLLRLGTFQLSDIFYNTVGGVLGGLVYYVTMKARMVLNI